MHKYVSTVRYDTKVFFSLTRPRTVRLQAPLSESIIK